VALSLIESTKKLVAVPINMKSHELRRVKGKQK